jgi:hypothetical protein
MKSNLIPKLDKKKINYSNYSNLQALFLKDEIRNKIKVKKAERVFFRNEENFIRVIELVRITLGQPRKNDIVVLLWNDLVHIPVKLGPITPTNRILLLDNIVAWSYMIRQGITIEISEADYNTIKMSEAL